MEVEVGGTTALVVVVVDADDVLLLVEVAVVGGTTALVVVEVVVLSLLQLVYPSPTNPSLHSQVYESTVSVHIALAAHGLLRFVQNPTNSHAVAPLGPLLRGR